MRELFIYYRSHADRSAEVAEKVREFQAQLTREHPQLLARLLRRPDLRDGRHTWMETYSTATMNAAEGIDLALQQQIEARAEVLRGCIDGERHTEVFISCAW